MKLATEYGMVSLFMSVHELAAGDHHPVAAVVELCGLTEARRDGPDWFDDFYGLRILFRPHVIAVGVPLGV